jgi:hypothetical protein
MFEIDGIKMRVAGLVVLLFVLFNVFFGRIPQDGGLGQQSFEFPETPPVQLDSDSYWKQNSGHVKSTAGGDFFTANAFENATKEKSCVNGDYLLHWTTADGSFTASAMGSDLRQHFVSGYLSNYKPFDTDQLWVPLKTISMKKRYMYDEKQYNGMLDVWQYSIEAYENTRGDCEDHSIVLCDWLVSLGYEARVAIGLHGKQGHAWVVLYADGQEFILEATQKSNLGKSYHYPLASLVPDYKPRFMFDHDFVYIPKRLGDVSHTKANWVKSTSFTRLSEMSS